MSILFGAQVPDRVNRAIVVVVVIMQKLGGEMRRLKRPIRKVRGQITYHAKTIYPAAFTRETNLIYMGSDKEVQLHVLHLVYSTVSTNDGGPTQVYESQPSSPVQHSSYHAMQCENHDSSQAQHLS